MNLGALYQGLEKMKANLKRKPRSDRGQRRKPSQCCSLEATWTDSEPPRLRLLKSRELRARAGPLRNKRPWTHVKLCEGGLRVWGQEDCRVQWSSRGWKWDGEQGVASGERRPGRRLGGVAGVGIMQSGKTVGVNGWRRMEVKERTGRATALSVTPAEILSAHDSHQELDKVLFKPSEIPILTKILDLKHLFLSSNSTTVTWTWGKETQHRFYRRTQHTIQ